jgi:imidazolonepropionase-like amidohydrolase
MIGRPTTQSGKTVFAACGATLVVVLCGATVSAAQTLAIRNARIVTVSGPVIERGTLVVRDGLIADVGTSVAVPAGAKVIEGEGLTVYPGLVDSASGIGLTEVPFITETDDFSDMGEFMPQLLAFSAFNINSDWVGIARSMGILHVVTSPSGGLVAGQGAVMALAGWTLHEAEIERHGPMALDFPKLLNYETPFYQRRRHPYADTKDYPTKMRELNEFFASARHYMEARDKGVGPGAATDAADMKFEAMIPVLKGQQTVYIEVQSEADIRKAVQFARDQKLNYILVGADDAPKMTDFLKENGVRLVFGPPGELPIREDDRTDTGCRAPARLYQSGVRFAFGTGHGMADDRNLRHQVGMAVACGLPYDVALRSVTLTPAEFLGVADKIGSIEKGKRANFVLADGDIFEYGTRIVQAVVNGTPTGVASHYTELSDKYKDRR